MKTRKNIETVKDLKEYIEDLSDDMAVVVRDQYLRYFNEVDISIRKMSNTDIGVTRMIFDDNNGEECLVIE